MRNPLPVIAFLLAILCLITACSTKSPVVGTWNTSEDGTDSTFLYIKDDGTFALDQKDWKEFGTWTYDKETEILLLTTTETEFYGERTVLAEPYTEDASYEKDQDALYYDIGFWFYRMAGSK